MDFIKTKKITFLIFSILVLVLLFSLAKIIMNYPKIDPIELGKINGTVETETQPQNYNDDLVNDAISDYELIGYRVDTVGTEVFWDKSILERFRLSSQRLFRKYKKAPRYEGSRI